MNKKTLGWVLIIGAGVVILGVVGYGMVVAGSQGYTVTPMLSNSKYGSMTLI